MKKIIVTLCSLILSLAGTFGINQLTSKDEAVIDKNMEQVSIEEKAGVAEDKITLPAYEDKIEADGKIEDKASEVEAAAPKAKEAEEKNTKETVVAKTANKKNVNKTTDANSVNDIAANQNKGNDTTKQISKNETSKQSKAVTASKDKTTSNTNSTTTTTNNTSGYNLNCNNVYIYKNIDLSNCTSKEEVVEMLQKNGYTDINMNNIQNISSLDDILSAIGNGAQGSTKGTTTTQNTTNGNNTGSTQKNTATDKNSTTTKKNTTSQNNKETTTGSSNSISSFSEEVLRLVNIERSKAGLSALTTNTTLQAAADKRAQETAVSFSHTRPNGTKFSTVLQEYGISYRTAGENIAYGQRTPQEVVNGWMNSEGHRANILNSNFNKIGIGVYQSNGVIYWSQLFTN